MNLESQYPTILRFVNDVKDFLGLKSQETITEEWLKDNCYQVLKFYAYILSKLENANKERVKNVHTFEELKKSKEWKLFNLIPLTDIRNHFIRIDALGFEGIFKELNIIGSKKEQKKEKTKKTKGDKEVIKKTKEEQKQEKNKKQNEKNQEQRFAIKELLESVFKIPKKENFTGSILTDGTSICFNYTRPKIKLTKEEIQKNVDVTKEIFAKKETRKLACDPGREAIYTIVEEGTGKIWTLSRDEYYCVSGVFKSRKKTFTWSKEIRPTLNSLSNVSSKGISLESYLKYLDVFVSTYDTLWDEYSKTRWAAQRLRLYGGRKRCFDRFWNKVLGNENTRRRETVIAYGGAKFAAGAKGEMSVPTSRAFKECQKQKGLKILIVDEFRTSKLYYENHQLLHLVKVQGAKNPLRGLLWCCSTSSKKQGFFVNRDVNAAWNILKIALERPVIFQRLKTNRRLPKQEILKVIKPSSCKPGTQVYIYSLLWEIARKPSWNSESIRNRYLEEL